VGGIESVTLGDEEARRRRSQKTVLERAAEPTFPLAVEMHSRHRWLVHRDVARTVDLLLRGQLPRPQVRELDGNGQLRLEETPAPPAQTAAPRPLPPPARRPAALAPVPLPEPPGAARTSSDADADAAPEPPLLVCSVGVSTLLLEQAIRSRRLPVQAVDDVEEADVVLALRQQLGQQPELRRQAQRAGVPILVIKADTLPQVQRGLERLLQRREPLEASQGTHATQGNDDDLAALEECRLAVEQLVLAKGQPVELLPRSARVRQLQAELAEHYQLSSAEFGSGHQRRLRIFPR
jgi:hypothetical protein